MPGRQTPQCPSAPGSVGTARAARPPGRRGHRIQTPSLRAVGSHRNTAGQTCRHRRVSLSGREQPQATAEPQHSGPRRASPLGWEQAAGPHQGTLRANCPREAAGGPAKGATRAPAGGRSSVLGAPRLPRAALGTGLTVKGPARPAWGLRAVVRCQPLGFLFGACIQNPPPSLLCGRVGGALLGRHVNHTQGQSAAWRGRRGLEQEAGRRLLPGPAGTRASHPDLPGSVGPAWGLALGSGRMWAQLTGSSLFIKNIF